MLDQGEYNSKKACGMVNGTEDVVLKVVALAQQVTAIAVSL